MTKRKILMKIKNRLLMDTAMMAVAVPIHSRPEVLARMVTLLIVNLVRLTKQKATMKGKLNGKS